MRSLRLAAAIVAVPVGVAALAGCNSKSSNAADDSSPSPAASVAASVAATVATNTSASASKPCSLLTTAQIEAATGGTVADGKISSGAAEGPTCSWTVNAGSSVSSGPGGVSVVVIPKISTLALFTATTSYVPGAVSVSGIGQAAFFEANIGTLYFFKGSSEFGVQGAFATGTDPSKIKTLDTTLAATIAGEV